MIEVIVLDEVQNEVDNQESRLVVDVIEFAYNFLNLKTDYEMSVNLVSNQKIREINRDFREKDAVTDVISFALEEADPIKIEGVPNELGDLFISLDKASEQAKELGHQTEREVAFLALHGFLHLIGYDHMRSEKDEKIMFDLQKEILNNYGLPR